jgi:hypothetical protein
MAVDLPLYKCRLIPIRKLKKSVTTPPKKKRKKRKEKKVQKQMDLL